MIRGVLIAMDGSPHGEAVFLFALLMQFQQRCDAAGARCTVVEDTGAPHEQIITEARECDVLVLGRKTHFELETAHRPDAILSQVRGSPRPNSDGAP